MAFGIEADEGKAELGYIVAPAARGRGVATAALRLLTDWGFSERGLLRLELLISVDNVASIRVAERAGYVKEGVLRSLYVKEAVREDHELWSCLPSDDVGVSYRRRPAARAVRVTCCITLARAVAIFRSTTR